MTDPWNEIPEREQLPRPVDPWEQDSRFPDRCLECTECGELTAERDLVRTAPAVCRYCA